MSGQTLVVRAEHPLGGHEKHYDRNELSRRVHTSVAKLFPIALNVEPQNCS